MISPDERSLASRRKALGQLLTAALTPGLVRAQSPADQAGVTRFDHAFGTTLLRDVPRRVASVGFMEHDTLLALGVVPIAIKGWFQQFAHATGPWASHLLGNAQPVSLADGAIPFETLLRLRPDLIVAVYTNLSREEYLRLSSIAPTITWREQDGPWGTYWEDNVRMIGRALRREPLAQHCVEHVHAAFAQARGRFPQLVGAMGLAGNSVPGSFVIRGPRYDSGSLLTGLGVRYPAHVLERIGRRPLTHFSWEEANLLRDGIDVALWDVHGAESVAEASAWMQRIGADDDSGRFVFNRASDIAAAATASQSVLSIPYALDLLAPRLAKALEVSSQRRRGKA